MEMAGTSQEYTLHDQFWGRIQEGADELRALMCEISRSYLNNMVRS